MPTIEAYVRAIEDPANLAVPMLRAMKPARNSDGSSLLHWPGAFGVVFRFDKGGVPTRAIKCFTRMHRTRAERYEAISDHLDRVFCWSYPATRFLVNSIYMRQGIRVGRQWHPFLLMDWVDAVFLHEYMDSLEGNPEAGTIVAALADQWMELALALKEADIAHGDLHHGNVLVTSSGQMKLIDYDGMCVPALANRYVIEGGHLNYQHPARSLRFDCNLDTFSALVILTALTALSLQPKLWSEYKKGNNMLFTDADFKTPDASPVFGALRQIHDAKLEYLLRELKTACATPDPAAIKPFDEIVAPLR